MPPPCVPAQRPSPARIRPVTVPGSGLIRDPPPTPPCEGHPCTPHAYRGKRVQSPLSRGHGARGVGQYDNLASCDCAWRLEMKSDEYLFRTLTVALAGALAGCAGSTPSPRADYTYCSRYADAPECGGKPLAAAAAPAPGACPRAAQGEDGRGGRTRPASRTVPASVHQGHVAGPVSSQCGGCVKAAWRNQCSEAVYEDAEERVLVKPASKRVTVGRPSTGR